MTKLEQGIISFILSKSLFFGIGFSYIIEYSNTLTPLSIIISYIIGAFILSLIIKKDIFSNNNIITKIFICLLTIICAITLVISFTIETSNFYLTKTPPIIIVIILLGVVFYGANKGIRHWSRLVESLVIINVFLSLSGIIGNLYNIDIHEFFPLSNINYNFIKSLLECITLSISPIVLLLYLKKNLDKDAIIKGYLLGGINVLLISIMTIGTLGITLSTYFRFPEYIALKKIELFSFIERIENIAEMASLIELVSVGIMLELVLYKLFNKKISYVLSTIIAIVTVILCTNIYQNTLFIYHNISKILLIFIVAIILSIKNKRVNS